MSEYAAETKKPRRRWRKFLFFTFIFIALVGAGGVIIANRMYQQNLRPVSNIEKSELITIPVGSTPGEIAVILEEASLIRKTWAFEWYVRTTGTYDGLKAGTYSLRPSQSVAEIVTILTHGKEATTQVTIYPTRRLDEVRDDLINQGFSVEDVDAALNPELYASHPALTDKPKEASLEGYIFPETFEKAKTTTAQDIITASLDQMQQHLTQEVRDGFARQGLTVHNAITLASVIEQEVGSKDKTVDLEDKKKVAQVFLKRLKIGMALESDATAGYGAILAGKDPELSFDSPYNTYKNPGLTPGPISNVGNNSLLALADPAQTDFLFFVSGDDNINYFSKTHEEHRRYVREHCSTCAQ